MIGISCLVMPSISDDGYTKKAKVKQNVRVFCTSSEDTVLMKRPKGDGQERQLNVKVHYKRHGLGHE